jgi:hypothetical protein
MKLCLSSSRGASYPAKGAPARAGSQPGAGRGDTAGDASADERAGRGTAAPTPLSFRMPRGLDSIDGTNAPLRQTGAEGNVSGGVFAQRTHEEDGPVTWEALASPRDLPVSRRAGDPSPTHDT